MPKLSQRGVVHLIVLLILLVGIAGIVYLVTAGPLKIFPKASISDPLTPTTSFTLLPGKSQYAVGEEVAVQILVHSDIAAANLFDAKINYDPQVLQLGRVDVTSPFIQNWVEQYWGEAGKVSLVGGVPNPGFQTQVGDTAPMATLYFTALKSGSTTISFDDASQIFSNANNANILVVKNPITLALSTGVTPTPVGGAFRFTTSNNNTTLTCRKGDPNCYYSAAVIVVNNTNQTLYNTTLRLENQGVTATYTGFNGETTSGQSRSDRPVSAGQEAINTHLRVTPPATVGRYTARLYADGQTCNNNVTPSDCIFYGAGVFTVTIDVIEQAPSPTPSGSPLPFVCNACSADMNKDGAVTILDFSLLATCFNKSATETVRGVNCDKADVNKDGVVTILDFSCFASKFNLQCSAGQERGESVGMDQETRRSLQAQLEGGVTPVPSATPQPGTGDGNRDGKINLTDLSILLSDFNKNRGFRAGIDLNGDGIVNTPDFILMRNLLIQRGVIRG